MPCEKRYRFSKIADVTSEIEIMQNIAQEVSVEAMQRLAEIYEEIAQGLHSIPVSQQLSMDKLPSAIIDSYRNSRKKIETRETEIHGHGADSPETFNEKAFFQNDSVDAFGRN